jgi:hypothetical protein
LESGYLGNVQSAALLGTWTVQFTSDTNGTLLAPDGTTNNFIFPPYNVTKFAESNGFNVYLGTVANTVTALGQAVVYSSFAISNVPSAVSDDFLADSSLDTTIWNPSFSIGRGSVLIVPSNAPYWVAWTLPAAGFSLASSASLGTNTAWNNVTTYSPFPTLNASQQVLSQQLISTRDLPPGNAAFFTLIKPVASQLQVLLPGETNAPGTASGKVGTPLPQTAGNPFDLTVNACDAAWRIATTCSDTVDITSSDTSAGLPTDAPLVNGTITFSSTGNNYFYFGSTGTWTITATDTTTTSIKANTSSSLVVGP